MTTEADGSQPRNEIVSNSTMTSRTGITHTISNRDSLSSVGTMDSVHRRLNNARKKGEDSNQKATISVRFTESYPKHVQPRHTGDRLNGNNLLKNMLVDPTAPKILSVTSDPETEFDWKDYNFKNGNLTMDPGLMDSNSDMETWVKEKWGIPYASGDHGQKVLDGAREIYSIYYPRDYMSQSSSNSQISSGQVIRPEQIRGILKAKEKTAAENTGHGVQSPKGVGNYGERGVEVTSDPYDISESIEAYNQYIKKRAVRFETDKSKRTKLRFLSQQLTIEKRAQFDRTQRTQHGHNKRYEKNGYTLPPIKTTAAGYKTIQEFEKRNVNRTASKMVDVENNFLKSKQTPSECCSSSDEDDLEEQSMPDDVPVKRMSVPTLRMETKRQRVERAMSLKGDETILLPLRRASQFQIAVNKVRGILTKKRFRDFQKTMMTTKDSRKKNVPPLERFRQAAKLVVVLLRTVGIKPEKAEDSDYNFLSWTIMYDELGISRLSYDQNNLTFDPEMFKANKESFLSAEVRDILLTPPAFRIDSQIQAVIRFLSQVVPAFGEYPLRIQRSTLKCCTYERFESGRVIIRQGHRAENFYFILSGTAVVTIMDSGVNHVHTVNILSSGNSFGELAFLNMSQRTATVTCRENMELLCIERDDFVKIFMRRVKDKEPEHVTFLKSVDVLKGWPLEKLPMDNLKICAFTYVRRGVTLCPDSSRSDWLFVVVSGTCRVLKALNDVKLSSEQSSSVGMSARRRRFPRLNVSTTRPGMHATEKRALHRKSKVSRQSNLHNGRLSGITTVINRSEEEVNQSRAEHATQLENIYHKRHVLPSINQRLKKRQRQAAQAEDPPKDKVESSTKDDSSTDQTREDKESNGYYDTILEEEEDDSIPLSNTPDRLLSPAMTPIPRTPEPIAAATPSQFLRPATQNFGIHRSSLKQTEDDLAPIEAARKAWQKKHSKPKVFIEVTRLEPGDVFGLEHEVMNDMDDVPATSLVSDGAEVVIIEKKFFRKHLTEETAKRIRQTIRPLPSDSVLQQNLVNQRHWDAYRSRTLETQARHLGHAKIITHAYRA